MGGQHNPSVLRSIVGVVVASAASTALAVIGVSAPASAFSNFDIHATALEPVIAGSTADVEFSVFNAGPDEADDTVLEVGLPAGVTAVGGQTACIAPGSCLMGGFGLIPVGVTATQVIRIAVDPDFVVDHGAGASSANAGIAVQVDYDGGAQSGTEQLAVGERADLRVRKYASPAVANAGESMFYQIDVDNLGPSTARDVVITDTLFAELGDADPSLSVAACVFSSTLGGGVIEQFTCASGAVVSSILGAGIGTFSTDVLQPIGLYPSPVPGEPDVVGGRLRASFELTALDAVELHGEVRVLSATPDPDAGNNLAATATSFTSVADLGVAVAAGEPTAAPGSLVSFAVDVTNGGPSAASNVTVRNHLPGDVEFVSAVTPDGTCVSGTPGDTGDPVVCLLGSIESGGTAAITVTARLSVSTPPGATIANRAWVASATADLVNVNDAAEALLSVVGLPSPPPEQLFNPVTPSRQFDTRDGTGGVPVGKLAGGEVLTFTATGVNGIPAGAAAVSINVTVEDPSAAGWISVFPCATPPAIASSLNFSAGEVVANAVITPVDALGRVCFRASADTHLISDVSGWFPAGSALHTLTPTREFDTRSGHGGVPIGPRPAGVPLAFDVTGAHGVPESGVGAVLLTVTVTEPADSGHVTVHPCGAPPLTSNGNFLADDTVGNFVVAPVSPQGTVCFVTSSAAHLVVDIVGWLEAGSAHHPLNPTRLFDTRDGAGDVPAQRLLPGDVFEFAVAGRAGLPSADVSTIILNVTAVLPDRDGYVITFPCGDRPLSSNLNFAAGQVVANAVVAPVGPQGTVCFYSNAALDLVVDASGWFEGAGV
jgi:uncharacterized repeat protein (TIGR01451 family)